MTRRRARGRLAEAPRLWHWILWRDARRRPGAGAVPPAPERACQCAAVTVPRVKLWRKMPKRVRPYGSAEDAESAGLGRGRPRTAGEDISDPGDTMTMRDIAGQAA